MVVKIIVLLLLILVNGFFASSEIAFLSISKTKLRKEIANFNEKAIKINKLLDKPSSFLAAIQIGITLAGFLASAFAADSFTDILVEYFKFTNVSVSILQPVILIIVTIILAYFTLVLGELVPKRIAMQYPEKISYFVVNSITLLMKIAYPFVWILTKSTNLLIKLIGIKTDKNKEDKLDLEEIKLIISDGRNLGVIEPKEAEYIFNVFEFKDTAIYQIMTPRQEVACINIDIKTKKLFDVIKKNRYTRFPVYKENIDNIIGILNIKDIIDIHLKGEKFKLEDIIRKPNKVYRTEKVDEAFRNMQSKKENMSIVYNKSGNFVGIVTTEDILEEIVGNIFSEYDNV